MSEEKQRSIRSMLTGIILNGKTIMYVNIYMESGLSGYINAMCRDEDGETLGIFRFPPHWHQHSYALSSIVGGQLRWCTTCGESAILPHDENQEWKSVKEPSSS